MRIEPSDERDSSWEEYEPRFRVYLFAGPGPGLVVETFDITDADAVEAIHWAQTQAGTDRLYAVALVGEISPEGEAARGLVWLVGMDANDVPRNDAERRCQARMRARRGRQLVAEG